MRRILAIPLAALSIVGFTTHASADDSKSVRGTITGISTGTVTVAMRDGDMRFAVDDRTTIEAVGAGTKTRRAIAEGKPGPRLGDVLSVGQAVEVTYYDVNGLPYAKRIRRVAETFIDADRDHQTARGTVTFVAADAITISAESDDVTTVQTFVIGADTKVIGRGFGRAAASTRGRVPATDLIVNGDRVSVSYRAMGNALHAAEVRVIVKAMR